MLQKMEPSNHDKWMMDACINLLKSHSSIYSDFKVVSNDGLVSLTSKVIVFLTNPSLGGLLAESDVILLSQEQNETDRYQNDVQSQPSMIEAHSAQTKENDNDSENETMNSIKENHLCQICGRGFLSQKLLQKHTVGLSNERSNTQCHICNQQFCSSLVLKQHLMVHTNFIHECPICGVKLKHLRNYRRHVKIHEEHYVKINCNLCSKSFNSQSNFQRHLKNTHKI